MVAGPLIGDEEVRTMRQQVRDFERSAKCESGGDAVVDRLGCGESGKRILARVEDGVVENYGESAVVETFGVVAVVSESLVERKLLSGRVVHTAIHEEAVRALLIAVFGRFWHFRRSLLGFIVFGFLGNRLQGRRSSGYGRRRLRECFELIGREELQFKFGCGHCWSNGHVGGDWLKALQPDFDFPLAIGKIGEVEDATFVGCDAEGFCTLGSGDGYAGNGQAAECDLAVVLGGA